MLGEDEVTARGPGDAPGAPALGPPPVLARSGIALGDVVFVAACCMAGLAAIAAGVDVWAWRAFGDHWYGDLSPRFARFALHHWVELEGVTQFVGQLVRVAWAAALLVAGSWWLRGRAEGEVPRRHRLARRWALVFGLTGVVLLEVVVRLTAVGPASRPFEVAQHYGAAIAGYALGAGAWLALAVATQTLPPAGAPGPRDREAPPASR